MELKSIIKLYCEIRTIQFSKKILKEDKKKLIQKRVENFDPRIFELFVIFKRFIGIHDNYSKNWMEQSIILEGKKTVKFLSRSLENIKKESVLNQILEENLSSVQKFKGILKKNLYKNTILSLKSKSAIINIIRKETLNEEDNNNLISILSILPTEDLISLLGYDFTKNKENITHVSYTTLELIEDVRKTLEAVLPTYIEIGGKNIKLLRKGRLSENKLGTIFGQTDYYIRDIVKPAVKNNPAYLIGLDKLDEFEFNIKALLAEKSMKTVQFFERYRRVNDPPISTKYKIFELNPQFIKDYFDTIDSIKKAYWLGYIYAEGWVSKKGKYGIVFGIECHVDDRILLDRFADTVGLSEGAVKSRNTRPNMVRVEIHNKDFANNLTRLGVVQKKSRKLTLPNLGSRELYLAFLMGLFDGDGTMGYTTLTSASKVLLEQIKDKFNLPYRVRPVLWKGERNDVYRISLGGALFNEMVANYEFSLTRKRTKFNVRRHEVHKQFEGLMSKEKLQELVWKKSINKIAMDYGVWRYNVASLCKKWGIKLPPSGYWNKKRFLR
ncbi:hypothetical protein LCGC14_1380590 [marine sediment metagenome]|uniref:DOD-type homing endonuclease domain-containing protein n=1 Tax=marine sediment metagenome TaxID=412755 RepID=A0A0F9K366_9ZZZZ